MISTATARRQAQDGISEDTYPFAAERSHQRIREAVLSGPFAIGLPVLILSMTIGTAAADSIQERTLALQFVPQEATGASSPTLADGMAVRPVALSFEDRRPPSELAVVGEGTDDDDHLFPWRSSTPIPEFAEEVFTRTAQGWGIRIEPGAPLTLVVGLTRFFVSEKDQAVGSSYTADVRLTFELKSRAGNLLGAGASSGSASRYGRKRSAENCNEVLSDAMKEAYAHLFDHSGLQAAWSGKEVHAAPQPRTVSPGALLDEVSGLKEQGFSTEMLILYIKQKTLSAPLSARDLVRWKNAGLPESVIAAALERAPSSK
jgi:hypothetical protein